jgi:predicted metal-dependent hydrolase
MLLNFDLLTIVLVILIFVIIYRIYITSDTFQLKCIVSEVNGKKYCVREREKIQAAADRLAQVNERLIKLVDYCGKTYPTDERCKRLVKRFKPDKIVEILPTSEYTAYSENKGDKIAFCLDVKKKETTNLIDLNTLTYVAIHELAHVCTVSIGHTPEFWDNYKFLLVNAEKIKIYTPIDYKKKPQEYCGINITDNPYFDV